MMLLSDSAIVTSPVILVITLKSSLSIATCPSSNTSIHLSIVTNNQFFTVVLDAVNFPFSAFKMILPKSDTVNFFIMLHSTFSIIPFNSFPSTVIFIIVLLHSFLFLYYYFLCYCYKIKYLFLFFRLIIVKIIVFVISYNLNIIMWIDFTIVQYFYIVLCFKSIKSKVNAVFHIFVILFTKVFQCFYWSICNNNHYIVTHSI